MLRTTEKRSLATIDNPIDLAPSHKRLRSSKTKPSNPRSSEPCMEITTRQDSLLIPQTLAMRIPIIQAKCRSFPGTTDFSFHTSTPLVHNMFHYAQFQHLPNGLEPHVQQQLYHLADFSCYEQLCHELHIYPYLENLRHIQQSPSYAMPIMHLPTTFLQQALRGHLLLHDAYHTYRFEEEASVQERHAQFLLAEISFRKGRTATRQGHLVHAITHYKDASCLNPLMYSYQMALIETMRSLDYPVALVAEEIKNILAIAPQAPYRHILGNYYFNEQRYADALPQLQTAYQQNQQSYHILQTLAVCYEQLGYWKDAAITYSKISNREPNNALFAYKAGLYLHRSNHFRNAHVWIEYAHHLAPHSVGILRLLIENSGKLGRWTPQLEYLRTLQRITQPSEKVLYHIAYNLSLQGRYQESEQELKHLIRLFPQYTNAYFMLAFIAKSEHNDDKAKFYYHQAYPSSVDHLPKVHFIVNQIMKIDPHDRACIPYMRHLVHREPEIFLNYLQLGQLYARLGEHDKALLYFKMGQSITPRPLP